MTPFPRLRALAAPLTLALMAIVASGAAAHEQSLNDFFERAWEVDLKANPLLASSLGDKRYNGLWPDRSMPAIAARHASDRKLLAEARRIDRAGLDEHDLLNLRLFEQTYKKRIDNHRYREFLLPVNHRRGIQTADQMAGRLRFDSVSDYEDWIARLESFDTYMDQTIELMRLGITERRTYPAIIMQRVPDQIAAQLVAPEQSGFYEPFTQFPDSFDEGTVARLTTAAKGAIQSKVIPAFEALRDFVDNEYMPACRDGVGVWDLPDGGAYYAKQVKDFTTTQVTPDEVHELGLSEVKRLREAMQEIITQVEFDGSFAEFLDFLRTDPRFYHDNADDLLQDYLATSKRIDPELVNLFKVLPRTPYGVKPIPDAIAPDTTTAYYMRPAADGTRAGYYFVNLYRPEVRPKYEIEVLTVHEAMPGHHLQIALAQELGDLPAFRRYGGYTAFVEGWGLYSESLGDDLGLYKDPYSKFGQLTYEMWRAVRLVVDTGMHHKRWTRDQAIEYFADNAAKTKFDIVNEIDRYIVMPGQALAYKIGELKIKELRARSEKALGDRFDIKDFHAVVLGSGGVPLDVLEANVDAYIGAATMAAN